MASLEYQKQWRLNNAEHIKITSKLYYEKNKELILERAHKRAIDNKESRHIKSRAYYEKNKDKIRSKSAKHYQELRTKVLTHYGNGQCACVKCGFDDIRALSIDHINGEGMKHRKELGGLRANSFYLWMIRNNYPEGLQTLCMNCQFIKRVQRNEHPHQIQG